LLPAPRDTAEAWELVRALTGFSPDRWRAEGLLTQPPISVNVHGLLGEVLSWASARKLRLFACACCRLAWDQLRFEASRKAVETAERFADGLATLAELQAAEAAAWEVWQGKGGAGLEEAARATALKDPEEAALTASRAVVWETGADAWGDWEQVYRAAVRLATPAEREEIVRAADQMDGDVRTVALMLRGRAAAAVVLDIFGDPASPVRLDPSWLRWQDGGVVALARAVYEERRFADLPVLADALTDAGCDDEGLLAHCRSGTKHARGCWVVDALLGKN
jgi:hypothetical protein